MIHNVRGYEWIKMLRWKTKHINGRQFLSFFGIEHHKELVKKYKHSKPKFESAHELYTKQRLRAITSVQKLRAKSRKLADDDTNMLISTEQRVRSQDCIPASKRARMEVKCK